MRTIYYTVITGIGPMAEQFLDEKMMILFKDNAPEDLAEYCFLHQVNELSESIQAGDVLKLDDVEYLVTAVGDAVNQNLASLGHITLKFTGSEEADLPGNLVLEDREIAEVKIGTIIEVIRR
ncbi:PTS glucitol/sorbitol transporter subunit IIA [Polycladomyces sp. WAk]|uniref:PTS glucitol/sorbitol transporter subunit IIA n=1 Tax=Polycladomyces zharkentensis TaxID=2807616 RepID=A0ABS2WHU6_9BACL|nr:PTS glucitol/sorbitol transporter subunit IIA [Polycladomyces sp. WAk]MBN2908910.1 PTS glucitol/sorbitol transporter subunit IIA [Polycladomyces sp. WAk]